MASMVDAPLGTDFRPDPMVPGVARVRHRRHEMNDVWTLDLEMDGEPAPFLPGQFNMLYAMGVGEVPISFSGDPAAARIVHTIRAVGAVSQALVDLKPGMALGLRGPFGTGWPVAAAKGKDVIILAGGIGLAPLRPVLYQLLAAPGDYGRITLLYGTRSPEDILFARELEAWRQAGDIRVEITVDHAIGGWDGPVGVVTTLITPDLFDPANSVAMICGPEVMMRFCSGALVKLGMPAEAIYLSMERNMKCAIGHCGHCQFGPHFVCKEGPVFRLDQVQRLIGVREF